MAKISNRDIYVPDTDPQLGDYVVGTSVDTNNKTKSYSIGSIAEAVNATNNISNIQYIAKNVVGTTGGYNGQGYFFPEDSSSSVTNIGLIEKLKFNKKSVNGQSQASYFALIDSAPENVLLRIINPTNRSRQFWFEVTDVAVSTNYVTLDVTPLDENSYVNITLGTTYAVDFFLKTSSDGGGSYTDEQAQDAVGGILTDSSEIDFIYDDSTPSITATLKTNSIDETKLDSSVNASLDLADSSLQSGDNISVLTNDSGYITGYTVTEGDVTAHEAALSITESQISDLGSYLENIVEDTIPTLGGDLDADGNSITNIDNIEVEGHAYSQEIDNGNSSTADTIDWTTGNFQRSTLTDNCTYTFTAPTGTTTLILKLIQDGTGSRIATFPASVKWSGGTAPTLTTTANAIDIISFYYDGTNYYGGSILDLQ